MAQPAEAADMRRVAVIAHSGRSLVRFRGPLIQALHARGLPVLAIAPDFDDARRALFESAGVTTHRLPVDANSSDRQIEKAIAAALAGFKPDAVVASGERVAAAGVLAGRSAGARRVVLIVNGLAALDMAQVQSAGWLAERSLRRQRTDAVKAAHLVVLHNAADRQRLIAAEIISPEHPHLVLPGSGVDLAYFAEAPLPPLTAGLAFLMASRLDSRLGALTFCRAARLVREKAPGARFQLAGPEGHGKTGLTVAALAREGEAVEYLGAPDDIRPLIAAAHVFVYPASGEGLPGAVLEAMSLGRPVITSTDPGCRQTVDERINGVLVAPGDVEALAEAMQSFLRRPDLIPAMARAGRLKAERRFDARTIAAELMAAILA